MGAQMPSEFLLFMSNEKYCPFQLEPVWHKVLKDELEQPYMTKLAAFVEAERALGIPVYPPKELVFTAFQKTPYDKVKIVIIGQDPYHGEGQAHGLSFSVPKGMPPPPSLKNIYKELTSDLNIPIPTHGCLLSWAEQGVMLLNATLTVRRGEAMSHHGKGWERFTDAVVEVLSQRIDPVIFVLWGKSAQEKCGSVPGLVRHKVLKAAHPSPLSANNGFFGCGHFSKINQLLEQQGKAAINWKI